MPDIGIYNWQSALLLIGFGIVLGAWLNRQVMFWRGYRQNRGAVDEVRIQGLRQEREWKEEELSNEQHFYSSLVNSFARDTFREASSQSRIRKLQREVNQLTRSIKQELR